MDKNKVIQVATRFVQKGQYDRAIAEYGKILREDPRDVRVLLKVGELQQKKGDVPTACRTLLQVAATYSGDGFFLKAVAVYKQVLKLDATQVEVNLKLAELYQQLGLMQDAIAQYGLVAAHHEKNGNVPAAIDAIRRLVDLEPDNLAGRINLAELFAKEGRNGEAVQEFRRAAEALKAQNRADDYLKVGERIVFLDQTDLPLARELANLYLARGDSKRALAKLQLCFGVDPRHVETLELLGRTFLELGQLSKAAAVYKELARVHADAGRADDARASWKKVLRALPDDPDAAAAIEPPAIAPAAPAEAAPAARGAVPLARIALQPAGGPRATVRVAPVPSVPSPPAHETPREQVARLIAETDVYVKYGLRDKAFDHLRRVLELDPESIEAHERASALFAAGGNQAAAWAELVTVCRICVQRGTLERGRLHYERLREEAPHLPDVASLADAYVLAASNGPAGPAVAAPLQASADDLSDEIRLEPTEPPPPPPPAADPLVPEHRIPVTADDEAIAAAMVSAGAEQLVEDDGLVLPGEDELFSGADASLPGADGDSWFFGTSPGGEFFDDGPASIAVPSSAPAARPVVDPRLTGPGTPLVAGVLPDVASPLAGAAVGPVGLDELDTLPAAADLDGGEAVRAPAPEAAPELLPDEDEALFAAAGSPDDDEILEVPEEAIFEVGDEDEALDAAPALPVAAPFSDLPEARLEPLDETAAPPPPSSLEALHLDPEELADLDTELEEASFFLAQDLFAEAEDIARSILFRAPGYPAAEALLRDVAARREAMPPPVDDDEEPGTVDLGAELAGELEPGAGAAGSEYGIAVEDVFAAFKQGVARTVHPEDSQTHYDLGIAYKEMGLVADAIDQFTTALDGFRGTSREADLLSMIALCRREAGEHAEAIARLEEALALPVVDDRTRQALLFELGASREASGDVRGALTCYAEVERQDPAFRGVGRLAARLRGAEAARKNPGT